MNYKKFRCQKSNLLLPLLMCETTVNTLCQHLHDAKSEKPILHEVPNFVISDRKYEIHNGFLNLILVRILMNSNAIILNCIVKPFQYLQLIRLNSRNFFTYLYNGKPKSSMQSRQARLIKKMKSMPYPALHPIHSK